MQALAAAGRGRTDAAQQASAFLRSVQNADGGFGQGEGRSSNSQSTAYAVQGLVAVGRDPGRFRHGGRSPLGYLRARQRADGRVEYSRLSSQTPVWVTAQAVMAFARKPLPLGTVARPRSASAGVASSSDPPAAAAASEKKQQVEKRHARRKRSARRGVAPSSGQQSIGVPVADPEPVSAPAPAAPSRSPGPQWLGVAVSLLAAALAAWAGRFARG